MAGFCWNELNPFGPLHAYAVPPPALRVRVPPWHTGLLLPAKGVGIVFTVTLVLVVAEQPLLPVIVTVYVPLAAAVAFGIDGFCCVVENPFGPFHA
jgi:hypothetical protein